MDCASLRFWVLLLAGVFPCVVSADTIWWTNDGGDLQWNNSANWKRDPSGPAAWPDATLQLPTYVTTSDHAHMGGTLDAPLAIFDLGVDGMGDPVQSIVDGVYVGGWKSEFDTQGGHGDPFGHEGILEIVSGELVTGDIVGGSPPCSYVRLGHRGAFGTVRQSGGRVESCTYLSVAFLVNGSGIPGLGHYDLSGGEVDVLGFDLGSHGSGILTMSGGSIKRISGSATSFFGRGYNSPGVNFLPGVGFFHQSGGSVEQDSIQLGRETGSHGVAAIRANQLFSTSNVLQVGFFGSGAIVQTGGTVRSQKTIALGVKSGGRGSYTVSGGVVETLSGHSATGLRVGQVSDGDMDPFDESGSGHFIVVGGAATIDIASTYEQNHTSRLTFVLVPSAVGDHISPIQVGGSASFELGSLVDIDLQGHEGVGLGNGGAVFTPANAQEFVLMTTGGTLDAADLALEPEDVESWRLVVGGRELRAAYCPPGVTAGACAP